MKGILLVLLVIAVVLFVSVESRRIRPKKPGKGGIHRPKKQGCFIRNCSRCDDGRRRCQECDDGFARITYNLKRVNRTIMSCEPCVKQKERKQARKQVMERDDSKCPPVNVTEAPCRKNCASCTNGECIKCNKGFALVVSKRQKVKFCISCVRRKAKMVVVDESKCPAACAKGCLNCTNGICTECKAAFELNLETNQCEKKDCGKGCVSCNESGTCTECNSKKGLTLVSRNGKSKCVKQGGKKPKRKGGKRGSKIPQL